MLKHGEGGSGDAEIQPGEGIMHPMFVKLFIEGDAEDLLAEEDKRHRARRSKRNRSVMVMRAARARDRQPRP
ncbi:MAG TPA: hypothetical protein VIV12_08590 [Streptosporangiaceae bacterium]